MPGSLSHHKSATVSAARHLAGKGNCTAFAQILIYSVPSRHLRLPLTSIRPRSRNTVQIVLMSELSFAR